MSTYNRILGIEEADNAKPRAQRKREGLSVSRTPHDHTQEEQQTNGSTRQQTGSTQEPASLAGGGGTVTSVSPSPASTGTADDDAAKAAAKVATADDDAAKAATVDEEGKKENGFYQRFFEKMQEDQKAREAQLAKDEKALRRQRLFASLGDGISALANVYFTSKGAPNMNNGEATLSKGVAERGEQLRRERLALDKEHSNMLLKLGELQDRREKDLAERGYKAERLKQYQQQQDRLDRETKMKEAKGEAYGNYYQALANKNDEQAAYWKAKAEALESGKSIDTALKEAKVASEKAKAEKERAMAAKYRHDANKPYSSGRSGGGSLSDGSVKVTERTDARGRKTVTRTYKEPARGGSGKTGSGSGKGGSGTRGKGGSGTRSSGGGGTGGGYTHTKALKL